METITINSYTKIEKIAISEIEKINFSICNQPTETLSNFYNRQTQKPYLLSTGGLFNMSDGKSIGTFVCNGVIQSSSSINIGIGITKDNKLKFGKYDNGDLYFLSGYPCLLENGNKYITTIGSELSGKNPRHAIGFNDTHFFDMTVDGRQTGKLGATYSEMQNWLLQVGCKYAINLDGGGSVRKLINGVVSNSPTENRPVDNVICVYLKSNGDYMSKTYYNNKNTREIVYETTSCVKQIGSLDPYERCTCIGEEPNFAIVLYNITGKTEKKVGFVKNKAGIGK